MAVIKKSEKACSVYPLKLSQPLGAVYAFLGIKGCMPIMHGSQGCAAFAKTFLTRNFWENIPIQTTALSEIATIMGDDENLHTALKNVIDKNKPELIGLVTTGVSETRGDDVTGSLLRFKEQYPEYANQKIVYVSTPDYEGSFHEGYKKVLLSTLKTLTGKPYRRREGQINLILGYNHTSGDVDFLKRVVESFGLKPVVFPDLSSMDGASKGFSSITTYGTSVEDIETMNASTITIAVGDSTKEAGEYLEKSFMIPMFYFDSLMGLENFDRFVRLLINISGKEPEWWLKRWRDRLLDAMVDTHFYLTGRSLGIAGEPDTVFSFSDFLSREMGMRISVAVSSTSGECLNSLSVEEIIIGDLEDILLSGKNIDLLIGNTNLRHIARRLKVPHYRAGIPIFDRLGHFLRCRVGYQGTAELLFDLANMIMEREEEESYRVPEHVRRYRDESGFCNQEP